MVSPIPPYIEDIHPELPSAPCSQWHSNCQELFILWPLNWRNRNDLFWKPCLCSYDLIYKLLNVFHADGVERSQNSITTDAAWAADFPSWIRFCYCLTSFGIFYVSASQIFYNCSQAKQKMDEEFTKKKKKRLVLSSIYIYFTVSSLKKKCWPILPSTNDFNVPGASFLKQTSRYPSPFLRKEFIIYSDLMAFTLFSHSHCWYRFMYWNSIKPSSDDTCSHWNLASPFFLFLLLQHMLQFFHLPILL